MMSDRSAPQRLLLGAGCADRPALDRGGRIKVPLDSGRIAIQSPATACLPGRTQRHPGEMFLAFYTLFTGVLLMGNFYGAFMTGWPRYATLAGPGVRCSPLRPRWQDPTWRVTLATCAMEGRRELDSATYRGHMWEAINPHPCTAFKTHRIGGEVPSIEQGKLVPQHWLYAWRGFLRDAV